MIVSDVDTKLLMAAGQRPQTVTHRLPTQPLLRVDSPLRPADSKIEVAPKLAGVPEVRS